MSHNIIIKNLENNNSLQVVAKPIRCPFCRNIIMPKYIGGVTAHDRSTLKVFLKCINPNCEKIFLAVYNIGSEDYNTYQELAVATQKFDEAIEQISPSFVNIYNQAYKAEQVGLGEICGMGYRKALEFLIKDYLISLTPDDDDKIKKTALGNCINNIDNPSIKELARRATWLGNDETHYIRKWEGKDINDLKNLIDLTCSYIVMEEKSKKYLQEMQQNKK